MRKFEIVQAPYNKGENLYDKPIFEINPGITVLVGCNGSGKSTMLHAIKHSLDKEKIPCLSYDNLLDGGQNAKAKAGWEDNLNLLATLMTSSEGEQIVTNLGETAVKIGRFVKNNQSSSELWVLLDAIDSGLSVDNVVDLKDFFHFVLEENKGKDVYFVISANEYELCNGEQCFDVTSCENITFADYNEYRSFILNNKKCKDKRYND
jgi:energy-coupling factor transporter ATP-binding protein EcfA2